MTSTFKEYLQSSPSELLIEMARPGHMVKDRINFDREDIEFLKQFPNEYKAQALQARYMDLLLNALMEREERRMPYLQAEMARTLPAWRTYYTNLIFHHRADPSIKANFHPETLYQYDKMSDEQKQHAVENLAQEKAKHDAMEVVEKIKTPDTNLVDVDDKYKRCVFTFAAKGTKAGTKGAIKNEVHIVADTFINDTIHRLETTKGNIQPNSTGGNTIIGKLGYWLWHATPARGPIGARTGGMMLMNSAATASRVLQKWVNAAAENLLAGAGEEERYKQEPDKYKFMQSGSVSGGTGAGKENTLVKDNMIKPMQSHILRILNDMAAGGGDWERNKIIDKEIGEVSDIPQGWKSNESDRRTYANRLAVAHLFNSAPAAPDEKPVVENGANVTRRLLYRIPSGGVRPTNQDWYVKKIEKDGHTSFEIESPKIMAWHEKAKYRKLIVDPNTGQTREEEHEHYTPVLHPGRLMILLPESMWKKDSQLSYYHNALRGGPRTVPYKAFGIGEHYIIEHRLVESFGDDDDYDDQPEDDDYDDGLDGPGEINAPNSDPEHLGAEEEGDLPPTAKAPGVKRNKGKQPEKMNKKWIGSMERGTLAGLDPNGDYMYFFEPGVQHKKGEESIILPTFGRWGEYIEKESLKQIHIKKLQQEIADPNAIDQIAHRAKRDYENKDINANGNSYDDFLKKYLDEHLRKTNPALANSAQRVSEWMANFMRPRGVMHGGHEPNHNFLGHYPHDRYSPDWYKVWHKIDELPKSQGLIQAIADGVGLGIFQARSKIKKAEQIALEESRNTLYTIGLRWLEGNLAHPDITASLNDPKALTFYIKKHVADLVQNASQQDIAGEGTRRLRYREGKTQSTSYGGTDKEGNNIGMDIGDRTAAGKTTKNFSRIFSVASNKRRPGDRLITRGAFDPLHLSETIKMLSREIEMQTALEDFVEPSQAKQIMAKVIGQHYMLFELLMEQFKQQGKKDAEARNEALKALAERHKHDPLGKDIKSAMSQQVDDMSAAQVEKEFGDQDKERMADFEQMLKTNPEDFLKELDDPDSRELIAKMHDLDPETLRDLVKQFGQHDSRVAMKLNEIIKEAHAKRAEMEFTRPTRMVQPVSEFKANKDIETWLEDPVKYWSYLDQQNVMANPKLPVMIDERITQMHDHPETMTPMALQKLQSLRDKSAALQINQELKTGKRQTPTVRNKEGRPIVPVLVDEPELQKRLNRALEYRDWLLRPEVLLAPNFEPLLSRKIEDTRSFRKDLENHEPPEDASEMTKNWHTYEHDWANNMIMVLNELKRNMEAQKFKPKPVVAQPATQPTGKSPAPPPRPAQRVQASTQVAQPAQTPQPAQPVAPPPPPAGVPFEQMVKDPATHHDALVSHPILSNKAHPQYQQHLNTLKAAREESWDLGEPQTHYKAVWSKLGL